VVTVQTIMFSTNKKELGTNSNFASTGVGPAGPIPTP